MTLFSQNEYHTPGGIQRVFADKFIFGTSIYFLSRFVVMVMQNRRIAVKGFYDTARWISSSQDTFRLVEKCGGQFHITGLDNLRKEKGPVVIISNHMSILETMIFPGIIAPDMWITFVVKDSLVRHPFFGPIMRTRDPVVLSRTNPREDFQIVMKQGQELLTKGSSIVIFPQSTRQSGFVPEEFNSIGIKLASKARVPVIPVAIKTDFWRNGKIIKDLGPIDLKKPIFINFGEPMHIAGSGKEEHTAIIDFITTNLSAWQSVPF